MYTFEEFANKVIDEKITECKIDESRGNIILTAMVNNAPFHILDVLKKVGCMIDRRRVVNSACVIPDHYIPWINSNVLFLYNSNDDIGSSFVSASKEMFDYLVPRCISPRHGLQPLVFTALYACQTGSELGRRLGILMDVFAPDAFDQWVYYELDEDQVDKLSGDDFLVVCMTLIVCCGNTDIFKCAGMKLAIGKYSGVSGMAHVGALRMCADLIHGSSSVFDIGSGFESVFRLSASSSSYRMLVDCYMRAYRCCLTAAIRYALTFNDSRSLLYMSYARCPSIEMHEYISVDQLRVLKRDWYAFVKQTYLMFHVNGIPFDVGRIVMDFIIPS